MMEQYPNQACEKNEEIGLVDLAAILVKRLRYVAFVFVITVLVGVIFILVSPREYQYESLFKLAVGTGNDPVQAPEYLISALEAYWLPQLENEHYQSKGQELGGKPSLSSSGDSNMIRLRSSAPEVHGETISALHEDLMARMLSEQNNHVAKLKKELENRIASLESLIERGERREDTGELTAVALEKKNELERELDDLQAAEVLVTARRSIYPQGRPTWQKLALLIVAGVFLGMVAGFFVEFSSRVRKKLR